MTANNELLAAFVATAIITTAVMLPTLIRLAEMRVALKRDEKEIAAAQKRIRTADPPQVPKP